MDYLKIVRCESMYINNAVYEFDSKGLLCRMIFDDGTFSVAAADGLIGDTSCYYPVGGMLDFIGKIKVYNDKSSGHLSMIYFDRV